MVAYYLMLNLCPFIDTVNIPVKVFLCNSVCDYGDKTAQYPPHLRDVIYKMSLVSPCRWGSVVFVR